MHPTQQQHNIIRSARSGDHLVVKALAGTAKTTTAEMVCRDQIDKSILLLCFNKSIEQAASARMPANTTCKTFHALGYPSHGKYFRHRMNLRFMPRKIAQRIGCNEMTATVARYTINNFTSSGDNFIAGWHVPNAAVKSKSEHERNEFKENVVCAARKLWLLKTNFKESEIPVDFDDYRKMFQLEGTRIKNKYDVVVVDEAQDITPRDLSIINNIQGQKLFFGDEHQQLYAWRGSVNSLDESGIENNLYLTQSFRFGSAIAEKANECLDLLDNPPPKLIGFEQKQSKIVVDGKPDSPYTILCRTNAGLLDEALNGVREGKSIHVIGGIAKSINLMESAWYLSVGDKQRVKHPELAMLEHWGVVEELAKEDADMKRLINIVNRYNAQIPTICEELRNAGEFPANKAEVILSTVHKAKGMEFNTVVLSEDFPDLVQFSIKDKAYKVKRFEVYCLYVAITRSMETLYANSALCQLRNWRELLSPAI